MYKCIRAFYTTNMEKWYYGMRMPFYRYKNLTQKEQSNFILEVEEKKEDEVIVPVPEIMQQFKDYENLVKAKEEVSKSYTVTDADSNEFQGFNDGDSGGGGASGEY